MNLDRVFFGPWLLILEVTPCVLNMKSRCQFMKSRCQFMKSRCQFMEEN